MPARHHSNGATVKARRAKALELRVSGASYEAIADALGTTKYTTYLDVQKSIAGLDKIAKEHAERLRDIELARCDALIKAAWPAAQDGDDKSINAIVRIMDRRAKLLGLDAPEKHQIDGTLDIADARESLARKLARLASGVAGIPAIANGQGSGSTDLRMDVLGTAESVAADATVPSVDGVSGTRIRQDQDGRGMDPVESRNRTGTENSTG
jgi:hypothetical protein